MDNRIEKQFTEHRPSNGSDFEREFGRPEYIDGKIPLGYEYNFPDGSTLKAIQNRDGIARIEIKRGDETAFDFDSLLAAGYKYVTPNFILRKKEFLGDFLEPGEWAVDSRFKNVSVGDLTKLENLLDLLHEAGHTHQDQSELKQILNEVELKSKTNQGFENSDEYKNLLKRQALLESRFERDAWAFALCSIRGIRNKTGINVIKEMFRTSDELKSYINKYLQYHRAAYSKLLEDDKDFQKILGTFFDKRICRQARQSRANRSQNQFGYFQIHNAN